MTDLTALANRALASQGPIDVTGIAYPGRKGLAEHGVLCFDDPVRRRTLAIPRPSARLAYAEVAISREPLLERPQTNSSRRLRHWEAQQRMRKLLEGWLQLSKSCIAETANTQGPTTAKSLVVGTGQLQVALDEDLARVLKADPQRKAEVLQAWHRFSGLIFGS